MSQFHGPYSTLQLASSELDLKYFSFSKASSSINIVRYLTIRYSVRVLHRKPRSRYPLINIALETAW